MREKPVIAITMGDPAGIGPEVIVKSLMAPDIREICSPIVIGSISVFTRTVASLESHLRLIPTDIDETWEPRGEGIQVFDCIHVSGQKFEIGRETAATGEAAARAIQDAVTLAVEKKVDAIVTGPTSKHALHLAGYQYPGQTEFLAHLTGTTDVVMMLVSRNMRVALVTTHCRLSTVADAITQEKIIRKLTILNDWLRIYFGVNRPKIGVCALNPHAGDGGIFGREEMEIIEPALQQARAQGLDAIGPIPADTLFSRPSTRPYDAYLAMYHDQGLVPLKMDAAGSGVNVTLGMSIIRTSPDHGTAFDIAGRGTADPGSMIEAIKLAARMAGSKKRH